MTLRIFCALPVPADVQTELIPMSHSLRTALDPTLVAWVRPGNFHVTLSFLGDVEQSRVDELIKRIQEVCQDINPFDLLCQGLGCFPNLNCPRVLWAGVESKGNQLAILQRRVATACAPDVQREEKQNFIGHITLGRVRTARKSPGKHFAREIELARHTAFGKWTADKVELLSSDLGQGTPRYSVLHRISLG